MNGFKWVIVDVCLCDVDMFISVIFGNVSCIKLCYINKQTSKKAELYEVLVVMIIAVLFQTTM